MLDYMTQFSITTLIVQKKTKFGQQCCWILITLKSLQHVVSSNMLWPLLNLRQVQFQMQHKKWHFKNRQFCKQKVFYKVEFTGKASNSRASGMGINKSLKVDIKPLRVERKKSNTSWMLYAQSY